jgi:hypothetical protein
MCGKVERGSEVHSRQLKVEGKTKERRKRKTHPCENQARKDGAPEKENKVKIV